MLNLTIAQLNLTVGDVPGNVARMVEAARQAAAEGSQLIVFPELAVGGYYPGDLLDDPAFLERIERGLVALRQASRQLRRFELVDPDDAGARITLDARPNRSGWVREALAEGVDRRVETQLLPLVGRRVVVIGRVGRNDLSARANDVAPASEVDSPPAKIAS